MALVWCECTHHLLMHGNGEARELAVDSPVACCQAHQMVHLDADVAAPMIIIPEFAALRGGAVLVANLGHVEVCGG